MSRHYPVMLPEILDALSPKDGGVYVDGTFGNGGYSAAILESADCMVYAIDRDNSVSSKAIEFEEKYGENFEFIHGYFGNIKAIIEQNILEKVDGFVIDVGVSSMQIDEADRGFSFQKDGPLDMRMDRVGLTAADIVNTYEEEDLANLIYEYGGERKSRYIAKKIVEVRLDTPFKRTSELADLIRSVVYKSPKDKIDPATRTFQALRIAVNDELGEIDRALKASEGILLEGGVLAVVSFHSLEDGLVKRFLKEKSGDIPKGSRHLPSPSTDEVVEPVFKMLSRKAIKPSDKEISENPRSRSARMRVGFRLPLKEGRAD